MRCPFCQTDAAPRALHAHLVEVHIEQVETELRGERRFYRIACPQCDQAHEQEVKPRLRDAGFLEEYRREIALVGFDMLINHLMAEHGAT